MFAGGQSVMGEIRDDISRLGNFADTSAEQVQEARDTRAKIENNLDQVRARFDVLSASRIDDDIDTESVSDTEIDIREEPCYEQAQEVLASTNPLHFPAAFPEVFDGENSGFSVIVGNPPWEQTKIERDEFWARHFPGLKSLTKNEREVHIDQYEKERPDLVEELDAEREKQNKRTQFLIRGPYPDMGRGDPDLYQGFSWRFWKLADASGYVGVLLPRAAFISPGTEGWRYEILDNSQIQDTTFLRNNRHWVFDDIHPQFTVALFSFSKGGDNTEVPLSGPFSSSEEYERRVDEPPVYFPVEEVKSWAGSAKFPLLPSDPRSAEVLRQFISAPTLSESTHSWRAIPYREDVAHDEPGDENIEIDPDQVPERYWPVFKGASFNPPSSELWVSDTGERYAWVDPDPTIQYLTEKRKNASNYPQSPLSEMPDEWVSDDSTLPGLTPRVGIRKIGRSGDQRTLRPSLIPPETFLNNTVIYFLFPEGDSTDEAYLLGVLNSIPMDWYTRRFVETHFTYQLIKTFPIPRPGRNDPLRERVVELSGCLSAVDERYQGWANTVGVEYGPLDEKTQREKIYELDAVVAHLYGLTREHVEVIFETFHDGWDSKERLERVLDYYTSWADQLDLDHADREAEQAAGTRNDD